MKQELKYNDAATVTAEKQIENRQQNKKALKFFIPMIIGGGILGGILGGVIIYLQENGMEDGLSGFFRGIMFEVAPWAVIICAVLGVTLTGAYIKKAKKLYGAAMADAQDGEPEEEAMECIEQNLSDGLFIQSIMQILQFMFFGVFMAVLIDYLWIKSLAITVATIIAFMVSIFVEIKQQQIIVDMEKLLNPSKNGSVYEINFQKKWEESCDELEKAQIYQSAYKAYKAGSLACILLWLMFAFMGMLFQSGMLPVIAVSVVWLVMNLAYMKEARSFERRS